MQCYVHPEAEAVGTCPKCGRAICSECAVEVQGKLVCRNCLAAGQPATAQARDPNTAFLIELVGGFFGLLGLGYFYVGRNNDGIVRLILWIVYDIIAAVAISALLAVVVGVVCIPIQLVIQVGVPLWSATTLKNEMLGKSRR
ncbi:MAG: hypothetical protein GWN58_46690 [Anaerolineae bacterium]|nr:hypothetical protein [Anaerolineae bacterium]